MRRRFICTQLTGLLHNTAVNWARREERCCCSSILVRTALLIIFLESLPAAYVVALTGTGVGVRGRDRRVGSSLIFFLESLAPCPVSASARVPITSSIAAPFLLRSTTVAYYKTKKSRKIPLSWPQQLAAIDR
jgi:hypothetical protein